LTSCDTNVLYAAVNADAANHDKAREFLHEHRDNQRFVLCEQVLLELYCLLRNPAANRSPLSAERAVGVVLRLRTNPAWRIVDITSESRVMDRVWPKAGTSGMAFRRVFDLRLAFTLVAHGVRSFATRNTGDFAECGFATVWDPLAR
jgi:toxin-antitoxin system PIN domain toxin